LVKSLPWSRSRRGRTASLGVTNGAATTLLLQPVLIQGDIVEGKAGFL
jgi:hypothetical protein